MIHYVVKDERLQVVQRRSSRDYTARLQALDDASLLAHGAAGGRPCFVENTGSGFVFQVTQDKIQALGRLRRY